MFQNLCRSVCFWGAQHDTVMISLSLHRILMGMLEFNCNSELFIQIKEYTKEVGLRFLKLHVTASWVSGGLWIQKAVLMVPFPLSYAFGLCFLNICLCDLVLFLGWIIWLVSHPAQFLPVLLVILLLGTPPSALLWLGHLYVPLGLGPRSSTFSPLLHPCRQFQNSRFSHSLICNYTIPSPENTPSSGLWQVARLRMVWSLGPYLIYPPGIETLVVLVW